MDNKITPGTWTIATGDEYNFQHLTIFSGTAKIADVLHDPDAAYIVRACNSHADLLEALENLLDMVTDNRLHGPEVYAAGEAITKAGGDDHV